MNLPKVDNLKRVASEAVDPLSDQKLKPILSRVYDWFLESTDANPRVKIATGKNKKYLSSQHEGRIADINQSQSEIEEQFDPNSETNRRKALARYNKYSTNAGD